MLVLVVGGATFVVWHSHDQRHPGDQLPHDPSLPTVVVLGNGWGSTAFLKGLENEGYNVVSRRFLDQLGFLAFFMLRFTS